jgi:predicted AAA+ superfamily ATPase
MEVYGLQEGLILTKDTETTIETEGNTISVKPVWKWLLE